MMTAFSRLLSVPSIPEHIEEWPKWTLTNCA